MSKAACLEQDGPALGDSVDLGDLVRAMDSSLRQTLATRLGIEWANQNPGVALPNGYAPLTITLDYKLLQSICTELARNTAQAIAEMPLAASFAEAA